MDEKTKILIADDHSLIRKGLKQVLDSQPDYEIMEAENGEEALKIIRSQKPKIAVLDIEMPKMTGFEVAQKVQNESISVDLIFLTMFNDESIFNKAIDIGIKGYVLKENTVTEIVQCIHTVLKGNYYLSPAISDFLIRRNNRHNSGNLITRGKEALTNSERAIMKELASLKTNQEIAESLSISIKTVQNHRTNICNKLKLKGTHALLKYAIENVNQF